MSMVPEHYPDCANRVDVFEDDFVDIDQQAACLTDYDQRYRQLSAGRYRGWFKTLLLGPSIGVYFETFNQRLDQSGASPRDHYGFIFLFDECKACTLRDRPFGSSDILYLPPGAGFDFSAGPGTQYCVISLARSAFEPFLAACAPDDGVASSARGAGVIQDAVKAQTLRQMARHAVRMADDCSGPAVVKGTLAGFQMSLVSLLAGYAVSGRASESLRDADRRTVSADAAFAARDYLHVNGTAGLTVLDLAQRLGVSRRKLEYSFRAQFDLGPAEYIRLVQLNDFRSALLDGANRDLSIGDIAARFGIWHLSRLAHNYRKQFGELPSDTRKTVV